MLRRMDPQPIYRKIDPQPDIPTYNGSDTESFSVWWKTFLIWGERNPPPADMPYAQHMLIEDVWYWSNNCWPYPPSDMIGASIVLHEGEWYWAS